MPGPDSPDWSGAPVTTAQPSTVTMVQASEIGVAATLVPAVAGRRIVVTGLGMIAQSVTLGRLLGQVLAVVGYGGMTDDEIVTRLAISPEQPAYQATIPPQAAELPVGEELIVDAISQLGCGTQYVAITAIYYLV